jgi:hypothetical protein
MSNPNGSVLVRCINDDYNSLTVPGWKYREPPKGWLIKKGEVYKVRRTYQINRRLRENHKIFDVPTIFLLEGINRGIVFDCTRTGERVELGFNSERFEITSD